MYETDAKKGTMKLSGIPMLHWKMRERRYDAERTAARRQDARKAGSHFKTTVTSPTNKRQSRIAMGGEENKMVTALPTALPSSESDPFGGPTVFTYCKRLVECRPVRFSQQVSGTCVILGLRPLRPRITSIYSSCCSLVG